MASQQQLFALLAALEKLPAASVPLDAERARLLGVPTRPDSAFAGATEALFHFLEQPRPDPAVIEALVDVLEHVTASPGALRGPLGLRMAAPHPRDMSPAPLPPPAKKGRQKSEEQQSRVVPAPKSAAEVLLETPESGWVTGDVIDRRGAAAFLHLVHGRGDPAAPAVKGARDPLAWKRTMQKGDLAEWRKKILELLAKHGPSTYNALSVHATGLAAEVTFQELPDKALWSLVSDGLVEHTLVAPVLFRLVQRRKGAATSCGVSPAKPKRKT
jgi:hypothetical protein